MPPRIEISTSRPVNASSGRLSSLLILLTARLSAPTNNSSTRPSRRSCEIQKLSGGLGAGVTPGLVGFLAFFGARGAKTGAGVLKCRGGL